MNIIVKSEFVLLQIILKHEPEQNESVKNKVSRLIIIFINKKYKDFKLKVQNSVFLFFF